MVVGRWPNYAFLFFVLGTLMMIGVGALSSGNDEIILTLFGCIFLAYFGWSGGGMVAGRTIPIQHGLTVRTDDATTHIALAVTSVTIIGAFLVIAGGYGLPVFADDPSIARLDQRNYGVLMLLIEHGLPLMLGFAVISYQQHQLSGKALALLLLAGLVISTLLAVRYLFFQALMVMYVLTISKMDMKRALWNSLLVLVIALVFFAGVQMLRSGSMLDEGMVNRLARRLFIIHYEIFDKSLNWDGEIPYVTYFSPLYKLMGAGGFNLGFELFNALEVGKGAVVQGYAPVSILGEALLNTQEQFAGLLLIGTIFFLMRMFIAWMSSFIRGRDQVLFYAIVCMMMFRTYAHSLVGFIYSLAIFIGMILLIRLATQAVVERRWSQKVGTIKQGNAE